MKFANFVLDALLPLILQELRRLRLSLGHILTTGTAAIVVMSLFLYIFGDFIQGKLPEINQKLAADAQYYFLMVIILFWSIILTRWSKSVLYTRHNWFQVLKSFGQPEILLNRMLTSSSLFILIMGTSSFCFLLDGLVWQLSTHHWVVAVLTIPIASFYLHRVTHNASIDSPQTEYSFQISFNDPLYARRFTRVSTENWTGSNLKKLAALPIVFGIASLATKSPVELSHICSLIGGIILSWTVPFLIAEDLHATWIERQAAVTHEQWIGAWQRIFTKWAIKIFATTSALYFIVFVLANYWTQTFDFNIITKQVGQSLLGGFLAAFPVWIAPAFIMQIDGRKIMTNIVLLSLIGIFAGTALIAIPLLVPGIYFLFREAHRYQGGRFARGTYN